MRMAGRTVTDGLVLSLDAGISTSYPGSGATWFDLSGRNSNGTLINSPTFDSSNLGNLLFNGFSQYCSFSASNLGTTTTIEMWCKIGSGYTDKMFFGWLLYDVWCGSGNLGYNTASSDVYGISSATVSSLGLVNNWKHYIFEMRSDVSYTNNKIYINTALQTLSQQSGTENAANRNFNNGNGRIAIWVNDVGYLMPMNCALFKIYNRALTTSEILQNYTVTKRRFNIK